MVDYHAVYHPQRAVLCREVPAAVSATPAAAAMASLEDDVLELLIQDEQPGKPTADPKKLEVERFWGARKKNNLSQSHELRVGSCRLQRAFG